MRTAQQLRDLYTESNTTRKLSYEEIEKQLIREPCAWEFSEVEVPEDSQEFLKTLGYTVDKKNSGYVIIGYKFDRKP